MPSGTDPASHDLCQRIAARDGCEGAERAVVRLLAGIEAGAASGGLVPAYSDAIVRHGATIRAAGGPALLSLVFDRLCTVAPPEKRSRRFDILADAWAPLLTRRCHPVLQAQGAPDARG